MLSYIPEERQCARGKMNENQDNCRRCDATKIELANRLFFRLYQCANMLHKTGKPRGRGGRPHDPAVGGPRRTVAQVGPRRRQRRRSREISDGQPTKHHRPAQPHGARRSHRHGSGCARPQVETRHDDRRRPPRLAGSWPCPKIHAYYEQVLADFSINDAARMLHYLLKHPRKYAAVGRRVLFGPG